MINIDSNNPKAIYEQVYDEIVRLIMSKVYKPDDKLPSVRELASMVKINPNTIQKAYKYLEEDNYIYSVKGVGSFVKEAEELRSLHLENMRQDLYKIIKSLKKFGLSDKNIIETVKGILNPSGEGGRSDVGDR